MGERCAAAGCGRFVGAGTRWCDRHASAADDRSGDDNEAAEKMRRRVREAFRRRLAAGEYRELFGEGLGEALTRAAAEPGLGDEIGALRITLARLLVEEEDLGRLATSVARVAGVAIQAAREQRVSRCQGEAGEQGSGWEELLARLAAEDEDEDEDEANTAGWREGTGPPAVGWEEEP